MADAGTKAPNRDEQIRTNALQEAVAYHVAHDPAVGVEDVVTTAERFRKFIQEGV